MTDHRLIRSKMNLRIRPASRRTGGTKKINCEALREIQNREALEEMIRLLKEEIDNQHFADPGAKWDEFSRKLTRKAQELLGCATKKHRDWFEECGHEVRTLLEEKNKAHAACLGNPSSIFLGNASLS